MSTKISSWVSSAQQTAIRNEMKQRLIQYKGGSCSMCKGMFPACCYDFHHRTPNEKDFEISQRLYILSFEELTAEADKCDLLCANCHRIIQSEDPTHKERMKAAAKKRWEKYRQKQAERTIKQFETF